MHNYGALPWVGTRVEDPKFMDLMLDQALFYLDQFDWFNGLLIHLNGDPIKHTGSNLNFNRPKLSLKISKLNVG